MRNLSLAASALAALTSLTACGADDPAENFVGAYQANLTISGSGSQTYTDSVTITDGTTSDLIVQSQQIGTLRATIIGASSFAFDPQVLNVNANGQTVAVNVNGQGTINDGVLSATGTFSSSNGALSFTLNGSRL